MKIHCPHCGVKGSADDSYYGKNVKCPKCQEIFVALEAVTGERERDMADEPALSVSAGEQVLAESLTDLRDEEDILDELGMLAEEETPVEEVPAEETEIGYEEKPTEDLAETEIAEAAAGGVEENGQSPDMEEPPGAIPPAEIDLEEPPAEPVKAVESRESVFIFEEHGDEGQTVQEVERQPYGLVKEQCWQCGKEAGGGVPFIARDGRLFCPDCVVVEEAETGREELDFTDQGGGGPLPAAGAASAGGPAEGPKYRFTVGGVLREAWEKTKGVKGAILAGSAVMYLVLLILVACGAFLLPMNGNGLPADTTVIGVVGNILFQAVTNALSVLFTAGLLFMGIRKVAGDPVSWRMVFAGFPVAGRIIVAAILQSILVFVGILLLVLPGIYLAIGYAMTMPLIIDRGMSPWQAMEASRKAIHKVWWRVAGLFFIMGLIFLVSMVPLGIGTIWTWPMFFILGGVVYRHLFGGEKKVG